MLQIPVDGRSGEQRLIHDTKSGDGRGCSGPLEECPARTVLKGRSLTRSEEHTSELQSLTNLVCRLLLEKKKSRCMTSHGPLRRQGKRAWLVFLPGPGS